MKTRLLTAAACLFFFDSAFRTPHSAFATPTNLPAATAFPVMVDSNGVIVSPTNVVIDNVNISPPTNWAAYPASAPLDMNGQPIVNAGDLTNVWPIEQYPQALLLDGSRALTADMNGGGQGMSNFVGGMRFGALNELPKVDVADGTNCLIVGGGPTALLAAHIILYSRFHATFPGDLFLYGNSGSNGFGNVRLCPDTAEGGEVMLYGPLNGGGYPVSNAVFCGDVSGATNANPTNLFAAGTTIPAAHIPPALTLGPVLVSNSTVEMAGGSSITFWDGDHEESASIAFDDDYGDGIEIGGTKIILPTVRGFAGYWTSTGVEVDAWTFAEADGRLRFSTLDPDTNVLEIAATGLVLQAGAYYGAAGGLTGGNPTNFFAAGTTIPPQFLPAPSAVVRYAASSVSTKEIYVTASSTGITASLSGSTATFAIPAGVLPITATLRIPAGVGTTLTLDTGTNWCANTSWANRGRFTSAVYRESTGAQITSASGKLVPTTFTEWQVLGLDNTVDCCVCITFQ